MTNGKLPGALPPERNEHIFRKDILRDHLPTAAPPVDRPRLVLVAGQPGSGTTAVLAASHAELAKDGAAVRIVANELRSYHPQFLALQKADPETASHTQPYAGVWTEKLLAAATERGAGVVFETTMRRPENVERVIRTARDAGYGVEVRAVAVNPRVSWQGNHTRFEEMLHAGAPARIPPAAIHDAAVEGLRVSLQRLGQARLVDRIELRARGGTILYRNEVEDGRWKHAPGALEALEREQSRPLTRAELERFADEWRHVLARMAERGAPSDRITSVEVRAAQDLAALLARQREAEGSQSPRRDRMDPHPSVVPERSRFDIEREIGRGQGPHSRRDGGALVPARHLPDLDAGEIDRRLAGSQRLAGKRAEIEDLSRLVYGSGLAISGAVQRISNAQDGAAAGDDVRIRKLGELAGEGKGRFRGASPERQTAEANAPRLAAALVDYGLAVDFERNQVVMQHRDEQARQRQEIPRPSPLLAEALGEKSDEQFQRLNADPGLRTELDRLSVAITRRLSPADQSALKTGQIGKLAQSLGVHPEQAAALQHLQGQTIAAQRHTHAKSWHVSRSAALHLARKP